MDLKYTNYAEAKTLQIADELKLKVLLTAHDSNGVQAIFEDIVEAGWGPGRHIHHKQDETFLFLEGEFDVEVDGKRFKVKEGDVAFVPKGIVHAWKNVGTTPGKLRYIFSPALNIEEMFQDLHDARINGDVSEEAKKALAQKYPELEFVGPPL